MHAVRQVGQEAFAVICRSSDARACRRPRAELYARESAAGPRVM